MATAPKMQPSKTGNVPFATGTLLPQPLIDRIDRGIRDLAANYDLKGKLRFMIVNEPTAQGVMGWTYQLYNIESSSTQPIVELTNKSISGINAFLTKCGSVIQKQYGAQVTNSRKTA